MNLYAVIFRFQFFFLYEAHFDVRPILSEIELLRHLIFKEVKSRPRFSTWYIGRGKKSTFDFIIPPGSHVVSREMGSTENKETDGLETGVGEKCGLERKRRIILKEKEKWA